MYHEFAAPREGADDLNRFNTGVFHHPAAMNRAADRAGPAAERGTPRWRGPCGEFTCP